MIEHPIEKGKHVEYKHPVCACTGRTWVPRTGRIVSVASVQRNYTYKIDSSRHQIKSANILRII